MTSDYPVEHVLVVPTSLFHEIGHFQGFCPDIDVYLERLLDPAQMSYRPRDTVEEDPSLKQLIPYCVFRHDGRIFNYRRGTQQGEGRLHSKRSIGIGGHISSQDTHAAGSPYEEGMQREIAEEVFVESEHTERCVGLINDDLTEVGAVHLGVVHVFDVERPDVQSREDEIMDAGFRPVTELMSQLDQFESWSEICLRALFTDSSS